MNTNSISLTIKYLKPNEFRGSNNRVLVKMNYNIYGEEQDLSITCSVIPTKRQQRKLKKYLRENRKLRQSQLDQKQALLEWEHEHGYQRHF